MTLTKRERLAAWVWVRLLATLTSAVIVTFDLGSKRLQDACLIFVFYAVIESIAELIRGDLR